MTYLEQLTEEKNQKELVYTNALSLYDETMDSIKKYWEVMLTDMYGVNGMKVSVEFSTWSDRIVYSINRDNYSSYASTFRISVSDSSTSLRGLREIDEETNFDDITLSNSLFMDYPKKKGLFSVGTKDLKDMKVLRSNLTKANDERKLAVKLYDMELKSINSTKFYEIVKGGDTIQKDGGDFWSITKITNKCVYAVCVSYESTSRRFTKEQFFNETKNYVDLSEVSE